METLPCTSHSDDAAAAADHTVFLDTSLDTHLVMIVSDTDTVLDLKQRIQQEHLLCFPDVGEIKIVALKVKRKGNFYHLSDSMFVKSAFRSVCDSWFLSADVSAAKVHSENYNPHIRVSGNLIGFRSTDANTSADVVDLLPDGPSKRSSNFKDTFLLQDESNPFQKHQSNVSQSNFLDYPRGISENLQIGIENNADSNPRVSSPVPGNDPRRNESPRDFVNLSLSGIISKLPEPVKRKWKRECEYAVEKSLGENRMALKSLKESSRREIKSSEEGEKSINEEYPESIPGIQDQISAGKALQSGPTAKRLRETVTEGGENSLVENVNSDSVKDATRLEVRRSSSNVEGKKVDCHNGFISTRSKLFGNPNVENLRTTETVVSHVDGEANTALASLSISAGQSFSEQYFASPNKLQELQKKNNVISTKYYDADQAGIGDVEIQNEEPELGLSSENAGSAQVDHHLDEPGHPRLVVQQPSDLGDSVLEHSYSTEIPGDKMVEPKRSAKKTSQFSKTHDQVRPEACGRDDNLRGLRRKEDPSYISEHPTNLKDGGHDDRSGIMECEVGKPKIITKKLKKRKKRHDPVEAEAAFNIEKYEDTPSMEPQPDKGDLLANITSKEGQTSSITGQSGGITNDVSVSEVAESVRGSYLGDITRNLDIFFASHSPNNPLVATVSLNDNETATPEVEVGKPTKSLKQTKNTKKIEDHAREEMSLGTGHSDEPIKDISQALTSVIGDYLIDVATVEIADNWIRNLLDSLQQSESEEPNAVDRKSSNDAKKQKSSIVVDSLTQKSNDASDKDHVVPASNVDKVKSPSKSTKKSEKLNLSLINQCSTLNLKAEDGREINNLPKHGMLPSKSLIDEGIPLETTFEKDGLDRNVEDLQKSEIVKNQSRSNIVADGEVSNVNQTNLKDIKKVQVNKIKKKLDQPSSEPVSASSPKLNENQDLGVEVHFEVPVSGGKSAQSNKLKFTCKDAQRLDSTVKSSNGKAKTECITLVTSTNRKSDERKAKVTVRNSSQKNDSEIVNSSKSMRSLFGSVLFKDSIEESSDSDDEDETDNSDTSTRTPSNNSTFLENSYNDSDADADSKQTGQKDSGKSVNRARYVTPKDKSLVEIMKSSSRYKKAKLVAAESQLDDEELVPETQPT